MSDATFTGDKRYYWHVGLKDLHYADKTGDATMCGLPIELREECGKPMPRLTRFRPLGHKKCQACEKALAQSEEYGREMDDRWSQSEAARSADAMGDIDRYEWGQPCDAYDAYGLEEGQGI